jgi:putative DNA primase/helicase
MNAAAIVEALGDARRVGRRWRCRCPLHGGCSLELTDGNNGLLLVTCWAGCDRLDVLAELRRRGLLDGRSDYVSRIISSPRVRDDASRTTRALKIWSGATDGADTIARRYLASRGIEFAYWPLSLRFHPRCPRPKDEAGNFVTPLPAMVALVALVEHVEHEPIAVHCTYLRPDGSGKFDLPKNKQRACFGPVGGGAVRFGLPRPGEWFGVAEGIETALSVVVACSMPLWAALSVNGIESLILPLEATHLIICADHDPDGAGVRAANTAAALWLGQGRRVRIALPPALQH